MAISEVIVKGALDIVASLLKRSFETPTVPDIPIEEALARHITRIERWSSVLQLFVMAAPLEIDSSTVPLTIGSMPRKFRPPDSSVDLIDEQSLLQSEESFILLGGPGAGKTTTIKRLARHFFVETGSAIDFPWRLPILIRLREITALEPLDVAIARSLGLPITEAPAAVSGDNTVIPIKEAHKFKELTNHHGHSSWAQLAELLRQFRVGTRSVGDFIADLLNESRALVLLDGIDEVPVERQRMIWMSIGDLNSRLTTSKIIATCRSGDLELQSEGFRVCEIEPLSKTQIAEITRTWLSDSNAFDGLLPQLPYADIASRPLFLGFLITLYKNSGRLPEHPRHVYQRIIHLALEEWDRRSNLIRPSRYANFNPEEKLEFLAQLSYYITYKKRSRRFSHLDLVDSYAKICSKFQLPPSQASEVARELETHTGLIVENGLDQYEFSHSSLQEFLCAHYLVRNPFSEMLSEYLQAYPAPIALATSMSSDPNTWLCALLLSSKDVAFSSLAATGLLARLADERPYFSESEILGLGILRIIFAGHGAFSRGTADASLHRFLSLPNVAASVASALERYHVQRSETNEHALLLHLTDPTYAPHGFHVQRSGYVPSALYEALCSITGSDVA